MGSRLLAALTIFLLSIRNENIPVISIYRGCVYPLLKISEQYSTSWSNDLCWTYIILDLFHWKVLSVVGLQGVTGKCCWQGDRTFLRENWNQIISILLNHEINRSLNSPLFMKNRKEHKHTYLFFSKSKTDGRYFSRLVVVGVDEKNGLRNEIWVKNSSREHHS